MAKITDIALRKRGWKHKRKKGINPKYWYYKGEHQDKYNGDNYRLDPYPNSGFMFDIPYPNTDMGGWSRLRDINTLEQLDNLVHALETTY